MPKCGPSSSGSGGVAVWHGDGVSRLLIVHHSPTPTLATLLQAVVDGTRAEGIVGVDVRVVAALDATVDDARAADGFLFGTPANLGYMSGALKHFFDTTYNELLDQAVARPYGLWVRGETDTGGAMLAVEKIAAGLRLQPAQPPLAIIGDVGRTELDEAFELGASVAAGLMT